MAVGGSGDGGGSGNGGGSGVVTGTMAVWRELVMGGGGEA